MFAGPPVFNALLCANVHLEDERRHVTRWRCLAHGLTKNLDVPVTHPDKPGKVFDLVYEIHHIEDTGDSDIGVEHMHEVKPLSRLNAGTNLVADEVHQVLRVAARQESNESLDRLVIKLDVQAPELAELLPKGAFYRFALVAFSGADAQRDTLPQRFMDSAVAMRTLENERNRIQERSRKRLDFLRLHKRAIAGKNRILFDVLVHHSHPLQHGGTEIRVNPLGFLSHKHTLSKALPHRVAAMA